ncbi:unnamed protein product [Tilletia controversa]|nr:unnamed protein product [Tilletia controversa]
MSRRKVKAGALASDSRWTDKESKSLNQLHFPDHFKQPVDLRKVQMQVIRPWITVRVTELLGIEDEVVCEYATSLLEDEANTTPDPRKLQIALTGFLDAHAAVLVSELWTLLLSAQQSIAGIPQEFVERKKKELEAQRAAGGSGSGSGGGAEGRGGSGPAIHPDRVSRRTEGSSYPERRERAPFNTDRRERDQGYNNNNNNNNRGGGGGGHPYSSYQGRRDDGEYGQRRYEGRRGDEERYRAPEHAGSSRGAGVERNGGPGRGRGRGRGRSRTRSISRSPSPPRRTRASHEQQHQRARSRSYSPSPSRADHRDRDRDSDRDRRSRRYRSRTPSPNAYRGAKERTRGGGTEREDARGSRRSPDSSSRTPPYRRRPPASGSASGSGSASPPPRRRRRSVSYSPSRSHTPKPPKEESAPGNVKEENPEEREGKLREQLMKAKQARAA